MSITRPVVPNVTRSVVRDVVRGGDSVVQRYFTTIGATLSQYYSIPSVTVDRIVMDVYSPTGVTTGLPTGAPSPTANKYETLDFVYSGTIDEIGRNGATYIPDRTIIANVNLYFSGTLIHSYAIDEDLSTTTIVYDSIGSNNGTAVNIVESELFNAIDVGWGTDNLWNGSVWSSLYSPTVIVDESILGMYRIILSSSDGDYSWFNFDISLWIAFESGDIINKTGSDTLRLRQVSGGVDTELELNVVRVLEYA